MLVFLSQYTLQSLCPNKGEFAYLLCFMFPEHIMYVQHVSRCTACTESWHQNLRSTCSWHDTWKHIDHSETSQSENCCKNSVLCLPLIRIHNKVNVAGEHYTSGGTVHQLASEIKPLSEKLIVSTTCKNQSQHSGYFTFDGSLLFDGVKLQTFGSGRQQAFSGIVFLHHEDGGDGVGLSVIHHSNISTTIDWIA